jgi:hypothetical protein
MGEMSKKLPPILSASNSNNSSFKEKKLAKSKNEMNVKEFLTNWIYF